MTARRHAPRPPGRQRGLATLVVVMVLFFLVSLVAAYTSRNLIFEQKTSANQFRSTQAFEAAEAGVEWALTMLNGGLVDNAACAAVAAPPGLSFTQRYLAISVVNPTNGLVTHPTRGAASNWPTCVFNGAGWNCACPFATAVTPVVPAGAGVFPAFRVWLAAPGPFGGPTGLAPPTPLNQIIARPGIVLVQSNGCTRLPPAAATADLCLDFLPQGAIGDGLATVHAFLALRTGLQTPPAAAVTARLGVAPSLAAQLRVVNTDRASNGITVDIGNALSAAEQAQIAAESLPGTPAESSLVPTDFKLAALSTTAMPPIAGSLTAGERMFAATFGMKRATYLQQSGLRVCAAPACTTAADINALQAANPNRVIWVQGDLALNADIGTAAAPVLLVVDGATLTLAANVNIVGLVYITGGSAAPGTAATIELPNAATNINGALVAENALLTNYAGAPAATDMLTVTYDPVVLNLLRTTYGTYVRVPGSWKDFP